MSQQNQRPYIPGQRFETPDAGTMSDLMMAIRTGKMSVHNRPAHPASPGGSRNQIIVRNSTGVDLEKFSVVGLGAPPVSPTDNLSEFQNTLCLDAETPASDHGSRLAILDEPILAGKLGAATICGPCVCKVDKQTDDETVCGIEAAVTTSLKGGQGATPILWSESGTGVKWAIVALGGGSGAIRLAYCKTAAGTGTTIAAYLDTDSTGTEIEVNVPIYGPQATHNLNASSLKNLADGTEIQVFYAAGKWRFNGCAFDAGPCPEQT